MKNDFLHYIEAKKTFSVLSFNTWLLKTPFGVSLAKDIEARLELIPEEVAKLNTDVAALQEVWNPAHRQALKTAFAKQGYVFCAENFEASDSFHPLSAVRAKFGNGLMIFSKFPLRENTRRIVFSERTRPDETFVNKGAIHTQVFIPHIGKWVNLFNSHLGAISFDQKSQSYDQNHLNLHCAQTKQLLNFVAQEDQAPSILAMDFGVHYFEYEGGHLDRFTEAYGLLKSFSEKNDFQDTTAHLNSSYENPAYTFRKANPYVAAGHFGHCPDEVLDYVFASKNSDFSAIESKVVFQDLVSSRAQSLPLSDHYGVLTTFETTH